VHFGWPGPKVDPVAYDYAVKLANAAPAGARVVGPESVVLWLGALHDAPVPVSDRALYMTARKRQLGADEVKRRKRLNKFSAAPNLNPEHLETFREGLREYGVRAILLRPIPGDGPLRALLRDEGFELARMGGLLDLWVSRAGPAVGGRGNNGGAVDVGDPTS
jgi:hypothetical protein